MDIFWAFLLPGASGEDSLAGIDDHIRPFLEGAIGALYQARMRRGCGEIKSYPYLRLRWWETRLGSYARFSHRRSEG